MPSPDDPFGIDPFGVAPWARKAIYGSVPVLHRQLDERENELLLKRFFKSLQGELSHIRDGVWGLPSQRDPQLARGGTGFPDIPIASTVPGAITTVQTSVPHGLNDGQVVTFAGCQSIGLTGSHKITVLGPSEITVDIETTVAVVPDETTIVRGKGPQSVTVTVVAAELISDQDYGTMAQFTLAEGTDMAVVGVGWSAQKVWIGPGPENVRRTSTHTVSRIRSRNTGDPGDLNYIQCVANEIPNVGDTPGFSPGEPLPLPYNLTFVRPSTLKALTGDFGITFDENDAEFMQRSTVANVVKYIEKKSSKKGYEIRGSTVGFDIAVEGLWRLCGTYELLPANKTVPITGSPDSYTTVAPSFASYDEIAADVEFVDPQTGLSYPIMDSLFFEDDSVDGFSPAMGWAQCTQTVSITFETLLPASSPILTALSLPYGRELVIEWGASDRSVYGIMDGGVFGLVLPGAGDTVWIESETYDIATNTSVLVVSVPDTFPALPTGVSVCVLYAPRIQQDNCCWCRTHLVRIVATPTAELVASYNGDGTLISQALDRLIPRLIAEQVPIHVELAQVALGVKIQVDVPPFAVAMAQPKESFVITAPFVAYYDEIPADAVPTDSVGPQVSVTVVEIP